MRLIDADAFEKNVQTEWENNEISNGEWIHFREMLNQEPTVDAVEVVRCGECKHMMPKGNCFVFADDTIRPSASDYCSHGER